MASKKHTKRSNRSASNPYRRGAAVREPYDTVLIVCEGEKTEPYYFRGLIEEERLSSANVHVYPASAAPNTLVKYAKERLNEFERVYCVFDGDVPTAAAAVTEIEAAKDKKWKAILSIPCFEFWLILHFKYTDAPFVPAGSKSAGDLAVSALVAELPGYKKNDKNIYKALKPRLTGAMGNARRLEKSNKENGSRNPHTKMHLLVEELVKLKSRGN